MAMYAGMPIALSIETSSAALSLQSPYLFRKVSSGEWGS